MRRVPGALRGLPDGGHSNNRVGHPDTSKAADNAINYDDGCKKTGDPSKPGACRGCAIPFNCSVNIPLYPFLERELADKIYSIVTKLLTREFVLFLIN